MTTDINIDFSKINSVPDFHELFSVVMGFPDFYGKNNDAWIDCMSYIDDKDAGMSKITVKPNESLNIVISNFIPYEKQLGHPTFNPTKTTVHTQIYTSCH